MKRRLAIVIDAGEKTCASKPGKFCPNLRTMKFGLRWVCALFGNKEVRDENGDQKGWLQRLPECLAAEKRALKRNK